MGNITRSLRAALYASENLPAARTIVNSWAVEGLLVSRAKEAISVDVWCQTWYVLINTELE